MILINIVNKITSTNKERNLKKRMDKYSTFVDIYSGKNDYMYNTSRELVWEINKYNSPKIFMDDLF